MRLMYLDIVIGINYEGYVFKQSVRSETIIRVGFQEMAKHLTNNFVREVVEHSFCLTDKKKVVIISTYHRSCFGDAKPDDSKMVIESSLTDIGKTIRIFVERELKRFYNEDEVIKWRNIEEARNDKDGSIGQDQI